MSTTSTTDPQNELLTEVDSNNKVIGPIPRGVAHKRPDKFYRLIYVIVKDKNDKILLQKRSSTKDLYPNCWDLSIGGHVIYNESYLKTAIRELKEELGITASAKELKFVKEVLVKLPISNEFLHIFEYKLKPKDNIKIETDEVSKTMWMTTDQIKKSMQQQKLKWYPRPLQIIKALY